MAKKQSKSSVATLALLGASVAGIASAAYFFLGPKGKKNQKIAKAWAIKMKGDVIEKLEQAKEVSEPVYHQIIDSVAKEYATGMKAGSAEIETLAKDLKKHWKTLSKSAKTIKKEVIKNATKVAKKAGF